MLGHAIVPSQTMTCIVHLRGRQYHASVSYVKHYNACYALARFWKGHILHQIMLYDGHDAVYCTWSPLTLRCEGAGNSWKVGEMQEAYDLSQIRRRELDMSDTDFLRRLGTPYARCVPSAA